MKFLAIDTSGKSLSVVSYCDGKTEYTYLPTCMAKHSIELMDRIDNVLRRAHMSAGECDFFGVVIGPGSFTGIRIGIATVKGLCLALGKPAVKVTSLDCIAYAETGCKRLALVDAAHSNYYACGYAENGETVQPPAFLAREEVDRLILQGFVPTATEELFAGCRVADPSAGLMNAVLKRSGERISAEVLTALYLRKSSAEEKR